MGTWEFKPNDLRLMSELGISESQVRLQIELFQRATGFLRLHRPCALGDGIQKIPEAEIEALTALQTEAAQEGRFLKFVPASGAATRMFQVLLPFYHSRSSWGLDENGADLKSSDKKTKELARFISGIKQFAFFEDLRKAMARDGQDITAAIHQKKWPEILDYLFTERGLNYQNLPKGLDKFHVYPAKNRTAFEEHLVEAIHTVGDRNRYCRLHLTVSSEHESTFRHFFETIRPSYEDQYQCGLKVTFSVQNHSTDTLAVDLENRPFRQDSGELLFRPGGHGALLQNLNDLRADLIYMKNIDNVLPDRLKGPTIIWKKILGGYLVKIEKTVHELIRKMTEGGDSPDLLKEIWAFCQDRLLISSPVNFHKWSLKEQRSFLFDVLNRPIRVCGMVRNVGEPGGGPFWVKGRDGTLSLQIVEKAQIDFKSAEQKVLWASSSYFNPVDLVCSVRNYKGMPFDLKQYVDSEAVFITRKFHNGQEIKALELPGLWNGGMAKWITLFVEVPDLTFSPVKTINDLLKPEHLPELD